MVARLATMKTAPAIGQRHFVTARQSGVLAALADPVLHDDQRQDAEKNEHAERRRAAVIHRGLVNQRINLGAINRKTKRRSEHKFDLEGLKGTYERHERGDKNHRCAGGHDDAK